MKDKRGDISLSFTMIFSVIVIIAIIAVAIYAISGFLKVQRCSQVGIFYSDFQKAADRAWASEYVSDYFEGNLPNGIEKVCFGNLSLSTASAEYEDLARYRFSDSNLFLYPPTKACISPHIKINHIDANKPLYCVSVSGKVKIPLKKEIGEALVRIQ